MERKACLYKLRKTWLERLYGGIQPFSRLVSGLVGVSFVVSSHHDQHPGDPRQQSPKGTPLMPDLELAFGEPDLAGAVPGVRALS